MGGYIYGFYHLIFKSKGYDVALVVVDQLSIWSLHSIIPLKHPYTAQSVAVIFVNLKEVIRYFSFIGFQNPLMATIHYLSVILGRNYFYSEEF